MQCPRCGVFLEDDRDECFICGAKLREPLVTSNPIDNKEKTKKNKAKDDSKLDNLKLVLMAVGMLLGICLLIGGIVFLTTRSSRNKIKPIIGDLYYELDESFINTKDGDSNKSYTKIINQDKCEIIITKTNTNDKDYIEKYFEETKKSLEPKRTSTGIAIKPLEEFEAKEGTKSINDIEWKYLNLLYRNITTSTEFNILKYKYMSTIKDGVAYDIVLKNEKNNETCNIDLDNFLKTLKYIEE